VFKKNYTNFRCQAGAYQ